MTTLETRPAETASRTTAAIGAEALFDVQLLVARRADALARRRMDGTRRGDRLVWLRAELEVFELVARDQAWSEARNSTQVTNVTAA